MQKYGFDIFWSEEDGGYIATCPDFPGLSAFGETEEDALKEAKTALGLFIETLKAEGKAMPKVTTMQKHRRPARKQTARLAA